MKIKLSLIAWFYSIHVKRRKDMLDRQIKLLDMIDSDSNKNRSKR